jgi:outer membrane protein assembly factor BamB
VLLSRKSVMFALGVASAFINQSFAEDWPTFRGANRSAVSAETGLLDSWPEGGPKLVWTAKGAGTGYASPAVAAGRIYTVGDRDDSEFVTCFDGNNGKQVWSQKIGSAWNVHKRSPSWNGARGTPTVDGDRVYVIDANGLLACMNTSDGKIVWQKSLSNDLNGKKKDQWGHGESPLIDGALVVCTPGGPKSTMVALDKATGEVRWTCSRPDDVGAGHSSIVISYVGGRKVYVQNTGGGPMGVDAKTGELLWTYDIQPPTAFIPSPVIKDDYVLTVAGYGTGGALLKQIAGADGKISIKEIYGLKTSLDNKHGGVILVGDYVYAGATDKEIVYCADLLTGEQKWRERGSGSGSTSVIAADGKLFMRYANGGVALAKLDPASFKEISSFTTPGSGDGNFPSWAHPVIANGKLLLREADAILCYDIKR